ncbi:uncharacterized protein LOC131238844 [Magnolia sinica]|uniref:uncharacterized protein LOC131238844 n=1 Tax=Magnolia sinica TaxID=86752 RepID=UPI0026580C93|nr:uncharacterized protein LOC131238844 [Magnolia sinica]
MARAFKLFVILLSGFLEFPFIGFQGIVFIGILVIYRTVGRRAHSVCVHGTRVHLQCVCCEQRFVQVYLHRLLQAAVANSDLGKLFAEEKVKAVIDSLGRDKALSPDGFPMAFFQVFWEVVKGDVMSFMLEFYERRQLLDGTGTFFIAIIPKVVGADKKDFKSRSLIGRL